MYDYQFTNYIYIYIDEPRTRYVKYLNYRLRFDTVSNESNAFDLRRTKTSQKCSFFSINNDSSKNHENRFRSISITRYHHFYYYYYYYTKHPRSIKFSVHFSTRARYIRRSHDWIPLHGSLPWNINWPKCHWESIIPGENSTSTFLCHKVAGNCYFQS